MLQRVSKNMNKPCCYSLTKLKYLRIWLKSKVKLFKTLQSTILVKFEELLKATNENRCQSTNFNIIKPPDQIDTQFHKVEESKLQTDMHKVECDTILQQINIMKTNLNETALFEKQKLENSPKENFGKHEGEIFVIL